jgi:hypothetical protein
VLDDALFVVVGSPAFEVSFFFLEEAAAFLEDCAVAVGSDVFFAVVFASLECFLDWAMVLNAAGAVFGGRNEEASGPSAAADVVFSCW